jgi:hypothetical integral membrane protein (TIGR02206 family)
MGPVPIFSTAYVVTLATMALTSAALCVGARRRPGPWVVWANRVLAAILVAVSLTWVVTTATATHWSMQSSLPLALCDLVTLVAAAALWSLRPTLVELTYFWGLAGTLQALLTPDAQVGFPSIEFFEYVVAHAGIVIAALFLVVGQRIRPRPWAAPRVLAITVAYSAFVILVDMTSGADYMYFRQPPANWTLLRVLGPWPWYMGSMLGVAIVLVVALDVPFWRARRAASDRSVGLIGQAEAGGERTLPGLPRAAARERAAG